MKQDYRTRAKKFVREIFPFIEDILESDLDEWENLMWLKEIVTGFNFIKSRKVFVSNGYSRIALITSDYVVKINRSLDCPFCGNCESELENWQEIQKSSFSYLFAEITKYNYEGYSFYIMPRIKGVGQATKEINDYLTESEINYIYSRCSDLHSGNFGFYKKRPMIIDYACTE